MTDVLLGAVAYDPKVVTIWDGFKSWLRAAGLDFDYVLYSQYERQVEELVDGRIDVAWNSPLAWVRATRLAAHRGVEVSAVAMRDTDRDLTSAIVVRADSTAASLGDLAGATIGTGAIDSPQSTLLPLQLLRSAGVVPGVDATVQRFDIGVGLHGDHVGGEREAAKALRAGIVDAACVLDANTVQFAREGIWPAGSVRVLAQTGRFDHCNLTAGPSAETDPLAQFVALLLAMSYDDPQMRPLLDLEGLKQWLPGRTEGYEPLDAAVDGSGFYDSVGSISDADYRP